MEAVRPQVIAIDPGGKTTGVALFVDGVLKASNKIQTPGADPRAMACAVKAWLIPTIYNPDLDSIVVYERPQVYTFGKSKGDPNDLITVALFAGAIVGRLNLNATSVLPGQWTGGLPKSTRVKNILESPRTIRVLKRLSGEEVATLLLQHDAVDACGIGLWYLKRLDPIRVFSGATRSTDAKT